MTDAAFRADLIRHAMAAGLAPAAALDWARDAARFVEAGALPLLALPAPSVAPLDALSGSEARARAPHRGAKKKTTPPAKTKPAGASAAAPRSAPRLARKWTEAELDTLRRLYPAAPWEEIQAALPRRAVTAIMVKAFAIGVKRARKTASGAPALLSGRKAAGAPSGAPALLSGRKAAGATDADAVQRHLATKGVTKCPPAYAAPVAGAEPVGPLPHDHVAEGGWRGRNEFEKARAVRTGTLRGVRST